MTLAVILEGGSVIAVVSDDPQEVGQKVHIIDYDTWDSDIGASLYAVPQAGSSFAEAYHGVTEIEAAGIDFSGIRPMTEVEMREGFHR